MRVIPVVLLKNGNVVQSYGFEHHPIIGSPYATLERLLNYQADEVVILDISANSHTHSLAISRPDIGSPAAPLQGLREFLRANAGSALFPLAVGGGIRSVSQAEELVALGADKLVLNQATIYEPALAYALASSLGSQAVVASVNVIEADDGFKLYDYVTRTPIETRPGLPHFLRGLEEMGFGEIFLNNVSRDGKRVGQNSELITTIVDAVSIPVISCGGVGAREDFAKAASAGASAVAAANFFHSHELSYPFVKREMARSAGVREYDPRENLLRREEPPDESRNRKVIENRLARTKELWTSRYSNFTSQTVQFKRCSRCLYPLNAATSVSFSREGVCTGCERFEDANSRIQNERLETTLPRILEERRKQKKHSDYDCVVAVSGGKDSYFQTHYVINELGLRPLLVTYDANNWTEKGLENLHNMKAAFGVEHLIVSPPAGLLKKMNLAGFLMLGDMSWHAHVGIFSTPMKVACQMGIPFVFYGEHGREDLAGQFRYGDFPEITYRERLEHHARGSEWSSFQGLFGIESDELEYWKYPSDAELFESELRGLHLGSFMQWDPHKQTELVKSMYGFQVSNVPFDRTYRTGSNLDDMHENGLHDWLKYVKFGYGRATDHASKDVRLGRLDRASGMHLVRRHDPALPSDIERWLPYVGLNKSTFYAIANSFRSESVWRFSENVWQHPEGFSDDWTPDGAHDLAVELDALQTSVSI